MPVLHIYFHWAILATAVLVVALALLLSVTTSYDRENYRYALSAELQSVAAIFALVVTGSLVALQIVVGTTPRILAYVPVREFVIAVVVNVVTMAVDVVALLRLPDLATWIGEFGINFTVVLNGAAVLATLGYVWWAFHCTQSRIYLAALLNRMDRTDDLQSQREIIVAIEELGLHAGERRHVQTCEDATRGVVTAARLLLEDGGVSADEALEDREHPLRLLPRTLENLGDAWAREGVDGPVATIAAALGSMGLGYSKHDQRLVDADFPVAMTGIVRSCVRHDREIALYDFLGNKRTALIRLMEASAERAVRFWAAAIDDEIRLCAESHLGDAARQVVSELDVLVGAVAADQIEAFLVRDLLDSAESWFRSKGILGYIQVFGDETLGQSIQGVRARLDELKDETG